MSNKITKEKMAEILEKHKLWLNGDSKGELANLQGADLRDADIRNTKFSGAKGLIDPVQFLEQFKTAIGYVVYKSFGKHYPPNPNWKIAPGEIITEVVNPNLTNECGCGINVASLDVVRRDFQNGAIWKCLIRWEWACSIVVPYNTDGKFRCGRLELVEKD